MPGWSVCHLTILINGSFIFIFVKWRNKKGKYISLMFHHACYHKIWLPNNKALFHRLSLYCYHHLLLQKISIPLLIPTWYTIFNINYIKLSSSTCFERHPLIFRSMILIVHVCSLWYSHSVKANYCFIVLGICYHFVKKETTMCGCIALCWTISVS